MVVHSADKSSHDAKHSFLFTSMTELKLFVNIYLTCFQWPLLLNALVDLCSIGVQLATRLDIRLKELEGMFTVGA